MVKQTFSHYFSIICLFNRYPPVNWGISMALIQKTGSSNLKNLLFPIMFYLSLSGLIN